MSLDTEKCKKLAESTTVSLLNDATQGRSEITNLDYSETTEIIKIIEGNLSGEKVKYECEMIPVIDGKSGKDSYNLIIRRA